MIAIEHGYTALLEAEDRTKTLTGAHVGLIIACPPHLPCSRALRTCPAHVPSAPSAPAFSVCN